MLGSAPSRNPETEDVDWVNNWKQYFHQFYIDDILVIPSWENSKAGGQRQDWSFTSIRGQHSEQVCMRRHSFASGQLKKYVTSETEILDVGCGSGILGMLALKFGAKHISVGTDLDPCAIDATHENMEVNGIRKDQYEVMIGNIIDDKAVQDAVGYEKYDIVAANILADVLVPLTPVIIHQMKPGAVYITSGIIEDKENVVVRSCEGCRAGSSGSESPGRVGICCSKKECLEEQRENAAFFCRCLSGIGRNNPDRQALM